VGPDSGARGSPRLYVDKMIDLCVSGKAEAGVWQVVEMVLVLGKKEAAERVR